MKIVKLFAVAVIATVAFASCGGGSSTETVDSTAVVVDSTPVAIDTTVVVDTTVVADSSAM
jgi:hypothetical protein